MHRKLKLTHHDNTKRGMENACEPMKKRNSRIVSGSLLKDLGTIDHIWEQGRKGPQPIEGWILFGQRLNTQTQQRNVTWKHLDTKILAKSLLSSFFSSNNPMLHFLWRDTPPTNPSFAAFRYTEILKFQLKCWSRSTTTNKWGGW